MLSNSMSLIPTLKVLRFLGVPLGIILLLPGEHLPHEHATYLLSALSFSAGIFTCIPFSRLRIPALFWPLFLLYSALAVVFGVVFGWRWVATFPSDGLHNMDFVILSLMMAALFSLLFAQLPCILVLRRYQRMLLSKSPQPTTTSPAI